MILSVTLIGVIVWHWRPLIDRLFFSDPEMLTQRVAMTRDALRMWLDYPFFGVGINNYSRIFPDYLKEGVPLPVHNIYVLHLAEMGPAGLVAFLMLVFSFLRKALRLTRVQDAFRSSIGIGMVGITIGILEDGMFSFGWKSWVLFYLFWALAGWLEALERGGEEDVG